MPIYYFGHCDNHCVRWVKLPSVQECPGVIILIVSDHENGLSNHYGGMGDARNVWSLVKQPCHRVGLASPAYFGYWR